ncbi:replication-relaxation family protein [Lactococcus lactis]|uniref:replication-relaxation family protein n=1 Tax=Lactococcus lactis TaxID=1358 RepID=UPI003D17775E
MGNYVSKKQLAEIFERTMSREFEILAILNVAKFMTTDQLRRQFFAKIPNELSAKRAANRTMKKLEEEKLIAKLPRRIGGYVRENYGGSAPSVWKLTEVGYKILRLKHTELPPSRKHRIEGKPLFLEHDLGISEVATKFCELEISKKISQLGMEFEPKCWRGFMNAGEPVSLKPDLYARFVNGGYEESYFLEIDLATEPIQRIFAKCQTYVSYFNTGIEEKTTGLTPYIVWIVPDEKRRDAMEKLFREKMPETSVLFQVIMEQELKTLVAGEEK